MTPSLERCTSRSHIGHDGHVSNQSETVQPSSRPRTRMSGNERREQLLDIGRSLFAERGYDAATIRDIAKGAGMSTGAVFANFQDKAELFEAVLTEDLEKAAAVLREFGASPGKLRREAGDK